LVKSIKHNLNFTIQSELDLRSFWHSEVFFLWNKMMFPAMINAQMNDELKSLYDADEQERIDQPKANTTEYKATRARDLARCERVMEIIEADKLDTAEDYYRAAHIMNHGDTAEDARNADWLALRSSALAYRSARWLAAASYDRWQMVQGKPQKYGTNSVSDGRGDRLWDVDPGTTDEERAAWNVPPLAEQLRKPQEANRHKTPLSQNELREFEANAPEWLQQALKRWRAIENHIE